MHILRSLCSAFLMYSRIPLPQVEWREENRRYALCFFPLVGAVIGGLLLLWHWLCGAVGAGSIIFAAGAVALPVLVTGGIHMDGFCDVCDAAASYGSREKMLDIMDDPHIGSFAAIKLGLYILVQAALFSRVGNSDILVICALGFMQSRSWSALAAVTFKSAKNDGTLQSFSRPAHRNITIAVEIICLCLTFAVMLSLRPFVGIFAFSGGALAFAHYRIYSYKKFGGITGDIAGYFLQVCELTILACAVMGEIVL